jgi:hypothetical protein
MTHKTIILVLLGTCLLTVQLAAQKRGMKSIREQDLKMHMDFLASDELEGRATGAPGLNVAARYLAVQAEHAGLQPAVTGDGYFQYYTLQERTYDREKSGIILMDSMGGMVNNRENFYLLTRTGQEQLKIEGEVVFAGYGINDVEYGFNEFEGIDITDKIVMIMDGAPVNQDSTASQFGEKYNSMMGLRQKVPYIAAQQPKAIIIVFSPRSGINSIEEVEPRFAAYLEKSMTLKDDDEKPEAGLPGPKIILAHRSLAEQVLEAEGKTLEEVQREIDSTLEPRSFLAEGLTASITLTMKKEDLDVPNVFAMIEGSDPALKHEMVLFLAHFDHVGTDEKGGVFNGADDNASGTVALLEIAEAFLAEKKMPRRSVGFLWVSGEEIGLFGSAYFADHPLVPIAQIAAVINLDMVGRVAMPEDRESARSGLTIVGRDSVKVIGAQQSTLLMKINEETLDEMGLYGNYTYNDINHPERYFYRSDHISFARKDIPVLFYSTGTHADYHMVTDDPERIDYDKFRRMTAFCFMVGYHVAGYNGPITVDNPMSGW